jgi:hypothetical protein
MRKAHTLLLSLVTVTATASLNLAAQAQSPTPAISKAEYKADKEKIAATYKAERAACNADKGNAKDICLAQAKGKEDVDKAALEARYKPTEKNHYKARLAKADAEYAVAKVRCEQHSGTAKDTCEKEAKAVHNAAKAEAKAPKK